MRTMAETVAIHHGVLASTAAPRWIYWSVVVLCCTLWLVAMALAVWSLTRLAGAVEDKDQEPHRLVPF